MTTRNQTHHNETRTTGSANSPKTNVVENDFDTWASRILEHVDALTERLAADSLAHAKALARKQRALFIVDPRTGHTPTTELCWVCGTMPVHAGPTRPKLRGCRFCLAFDRQNAARLGLGMLLPLMDWPSQPTLPSTTPSPDPQEREALLEAWTSVSVLDEWRVSLAALAFAWLLPDPELGIDLHDWQQALTVGPHRSQACWRAYVDGYQPRLARLLATSPVPTERIMR